MSVLTLAQIRAIVRFRGDFRNTIRLPDANIDSEIQSSFGEFYELVADVNEGYWDTTTSLLTTASTAFVALPADAWRQRAMDRFDSPDFVPMMRVGISDRNRFGVTTGKPRGYRFTARGVDLYPTPDLIYTLRLTYTPRAPAIGSYSGEYYNSWEEYTIYGALIRLAENEERDTSEWQARCDRQAARVKAGASGRDSTEPERIPLCEGYDSDISDEAWR